MTTTDVNKYTTHLGKFSLWIGLLAGPIAWALQLQLGYMLVRKLCAMHQTYPMHLTSAAFLLVALAGLLTAWRDWSRLGGGWSDDTENDPAGRARFMACLGMLVSALFALVIIAQWIPVFVLNACYD